MIKLNYSYSIFPHHGSEYLHQLTNKERDKIKKDENLMIRDPSQPSSIWRRRGKTYGRGRRGGRSTLEMFGC